MVNNKVMLMGRLTRDAMIVEPKDDTQEKIAHFSIAVNKNKKKSTDGQAGEEVTAHFFRCTAFGKKAEFFEKYGKKGTKFAVEGHLVSGSYEKDGVKISTTEVVIENVDFCEKKEDLVEKNRQPEDQIMEIPDDIEKEIPFQ